MDWPRDATEYIRRVGRVCRGGKQGGVLSLVCGYELKMAKTIMASAIRGSSLNGAAATTKTYDRAIPVLERFDPKIKDWRARGAGFKFVEGRPTGRDQASMPMDEDPLQSRDEDFEGPLVAEFPEDII